MDLGVIGTLDFFSLLQNELFWKCDTISVMNIFSFPHQTMQLVFLTNCIEVEVILIHLGIFLTFLKENTAL